MQSPHPELISFAWKSRHVGCPDLKKSEYGAVMVELLSERPSGSELITQEAVVAAGISDDDRVIAGSIGVHGDSAFWVAEQIELITGTAPRPRRLPGLAGPNDNLQILLGIGVWATLVYVCKDFFKSFMAEAGKDAYRSLRQRVFASANSKAESKKGAEHSLDELNRAVGEAMRAGNTVILGFPISSKKYQRRNIGIRLKSSSIEELAHDILILANIGRELQRVINGLLEDPTVSSLHAGYENPDASGAILVHDDGSVEVQLVVNRGDSDRADRKEISLRWDSGGKII